MESKEVLERYIGLFHSALSGIRCFQLEVYRESG